MKHKTEEEKMRALSDEDLVSKLCYTYFQDMEIKPCEEEVERLRAEVIRRLTLASKWGCNHH